MDYLRAHSGATAGDCREALAAASRPLKESTVRTLLHRLEQKGFMVRDVDGRAYRYRAAEPRRGRPIACAPVSSPRSSTSACPV